MVKEYSFSLFGLQKEFELAIQNLMGFKIFIATKRAIKNGARFILIEMFKDRQDQLQSQLFIPLDNVYIGSMPSFSIPNSRARIKITANFDFSVQNIETDNDGNIYLQICKVEN